MSLRIEVRKLDFTAGDTGEKVLSDVSLELGPVRRIAIVGPSGSGKTTFCYHLAGIHPWALVGRSRGSVSLWKEDLRVGMVFQNPENQMFCPTVLDEVSFGGSSGRESVLRALAAVGLEGYEGREISSLSFGQKQRVVIAAFLATGPDLLILDEPTNNLDPVAAGGLFDVLSEVEGTVIVVEHDLERVAGWADVVVEMDRGKVIGWGRPEELFARSSCRPRAMTFADALACKYGLEPPPRSLPSLRGWAEGLRGRLRPLSPLPRPSPGAELLRVEELEAGYLDAPVLSDVSFVLREGEIVAVLGLNGAGKTTLLKCIAGVLRPRRGRVLLRGEDATGRPPEDLFGAVGLVFQNPDYQIFEATVEAECAFCLRDGLSPGERKRRVGRWLELMGIGHLRDRHPLSLSYGEKRRLTLASILVAEPEVILLDEPTTALDEGNLSCLRDILLLLARRYGKGLLITTHDLDFALDVADRLIILEEGKVVKDKALEEVRAEDLTRAGFPLPLSADLALKAGLVERPLGFRSLVEML